MTQGAHPSTIHWMRLVALDLLGVPVDDAHLDPAAGGALAADSGSPRSFAGQLARLPDALNDELLLIARAAIQQCRACSKRSRLHKISSAQPALPSRCSG